MITAHKKLLIKSRRRVPGIAQVCSELSTWFLDQVLHIKQSIPPLSSDFFFYPFFFSGDLKKIQPFWSIKTDVWWLRSRNEHRVINSDLLGYLPKTSANNSNLGLLALIIVTLITLWTGPVERNRNRHNARALIIKWLFKFAIFKVRFNTPDVSVPVQSKPSYNGFWLNALIAKWLYRAKP